MNIRQLVPVALVLVAGYLAVTNGPWGWFLFGAILTSDF